MARIIDLTHTYTSSMPGFEKEVAKSLESDGWNASTYHMYSHSGTHMDAPVHFGKEGTLDEIAVDRFICNCHMIRIPDIAKKGLIDVSHLPTKAQKAKPGEGLIFYTNWSRFISEPDTWRNQLPRISLKLAKWMVDKKISLIGVEPPSIADVNNKKELTEVHQTLLSANIIIVEGLTNLDKTKSDYLQIIALPLKIEKADGAPARVIAIEKE